MSDFSNEESNTADNGDKKARRKTLLIAWAIWTILGLSFGSESYLRNYHAGRILHVKYFIIEFLTEFYLYALFSIAVFKLGKRFPLEVKVSVGTFVRHCVFHLFGSIIFAMINAPLATFIAWTWEDICENCLSWGMLFDPHFLHRGIMVYWGIIVVGQGMRYFHDLNNEKVRVATLSAQLSDARLNALKMQVHPHFLFNTLNSITTLIHEAPETADLMINRLSDFLRMTLKNSGEPMVTLKRELEFVRTYLEIEKLRFEERLAVIIDVDEDVLDLKVPNLILQPLVENSIKHGVANLKTRGEIKIKALRSDGKLRISIHDNGPGLADGQTQTANSGTGVGLKNTAARLEQIYGDNFTFEIQNDPLGGTLATLELPVEEIGL